MPATIDALLPLSLLESVKASDAVEGWELDAVPELRNKRLGLSDTVNAQIRRYREAVRRGHRIGEGEVMSLATLIGRRADAEAVFIGAGEWMAVEVTNGISPVTRRSLQTLPSLLARPLALRQVRRVALRYLNGRVSRVGSTVLLRVPEPFGRDGGAGTAPCLFYESLLRSLITELVGSSGGVEHVRCTCRGDGVCEWRAEWRKAARAA